MINNRVVAFFICFFTYFLSGCHTGGHLCAYRTSQIPLQGNLTAIVPNNSEATFWTKGCASEKDFLSKVVAVTTDSGLKEAFTLPEGTIISPVWKARSDLISSKHPVNQEIDLKGRFVGVIIPEHGIWFSLNGTKVVLLQLLSSIQCKLPAEDIKEGGSFIIRDSEYYVKGYLGTISTPTNKLPIIYVNYLRRE